MTNVLLSADGPVSVYAVPDPVAKNLDKLCLEFSMESGGIFDETDFIWYLNREKPWGESVFVENLGWIRDRSEIPPQYRDCKWYNF